MKLEFLSAVEKEADAITPETIEAEGKHLAAPERGEDILPEEVSDSAKRLYCVSRRVEKELAVVMKEISVFNRANPGKEPSRELSGKATRLGEELKALDVLYGLEVRVALGMKTFENEGILAIREGWKLTWLPAERVDPVMSQLLGRYVAYEYTQRPGDPAPPYAKRPAPKAVFVRNKEGKA